MGKRSAVPAVPVRKPSSARCRKESRREVHPPSGSKTITLVYREALKRKVLLFLAILLLLALLMGYALAVGSYELSLSGVVRALLGQADGPMETVIWNIRFPRIVAAILSGWGLGLAGIAFQSLLKNPLASPSTLGISQGAAFGAGGMQAGSLRAQGASPLNIYSLYAVTLFSFGGALAATLIILAGENLTDKNYEYLPGYPAPGITILGGVNLSF